MKLKISESKIRQIVNEEVLKRRLTKTLKESKWPSYTAYLGAEILKLEWQQRLLQEGKGKYDDGDGKDEKCDYVDCEDEEKNESVQRPSPEWIAETASAFGLSEAEIAEATEIMNNEELDEGIGGFLKAVAKPYQNLWQTFTNITQQAANFTDPEKKKAAAPVAQAAEQMPEPEEMVQQAKSNPEDLQALIRQLIDLLNKTDQASDLDDIQPGLEGGADKAIDAIEAGAEETMDDLEGAGEEGGGGEVAVFKGKGGKGLQSFLARGSKAAPRLKGPAMGAVLKHIAKQLKAQGVTVNESVLDEVQGWIWYGLVESAMQQHYGAPITIQEILDEKNKRKKRGKGSRQRRRGGRGSRQRRDAKAVSGKEMARRQAQSDNDLGRLAQSDNAKKGMRDRAAADSAAAEVNALGDADGDGSDDTSADISADDVPGAPEAPAEEPAGEEAAPEEVKPTVQNTAPEGSPLVKVFKGKGGEGLQSALARSRDKLGIDQQTVAVIIKSVEQWAQANQIRVENITEDVFDSIITELAAKYRARRLQETINKLRS